MKKLLIGIFVFAIAVVVAVPAYAKANKADVCHVEGNGSYHLINVSTNAVPAHLAHGDGLPSEAVPRMSEGYYFTDKCGVAFKDITAPSVPTNLHWVNRADETVACGSTITDLVAGAVKADWDDSTDNVGVDHYEYVSFNPPGGWQWSTVVTNSEYGDVNYTPTVGEYGFMVRAVDAAGNKSDWTDINQDLAGSCQITFSNPVCGYNVVPSGEATYGGHYGGTVTPVTVTHEDCSVTNALRTDVSQSYGSFGWAGWSCVEVGYPNVIGGGYTPNTATVANSLAWESGATVGGIYNYPTTPWGYSYAAGETGWIVQAGESNVPTSIYVICAP